MAGGDYNQLSMQWRQASLYGMPGRLMAQLWKSRMLGLPNKDTPVHDSASDTPKAPSGNDDCPGDADRPTSLQQTVSWIEQDSASQPFEYLEACNTRQSGE